MDTANVQYPASTSTVTPLVITQQPRFRALPKAFNGFLRHSAYNDGAVHGRVFNAQQAAYNTANTSLSRKLKGRHLQMLAIGGSIGKCHNIGFFSFFLLEKKNTRKEKKISMPINTLQALVYSSALGKH